MYIIVDARAEWNVRKKGCVVNFEENGEYFMDVFPARVRAAVFSCRFYLLRPIRSLILILGPLSLSALQR